MNVLTRLIKSPKFLNTKWRHFSNIIREELTVQTFCDIHVKVPYNVKIQPLDVHKYHNCNLLRIELQGVKSTRNKVKHVQDGNNIQIFASTEDYDEEITCSIQAPVKADLNIDAQGTISAGVFSGSKLVLKSTKGNIYLDKFQGETIDLNTHDGDIIMKGAVVASDIKATVTNYGTIKAKRIQGLNAMLKTNEGNICVDSSYCDNTIFEGVSGDLNLQNIHKNSKIVLKNGRLSLTGLDGQLMVELENSCADIQISRILEDSKIRMTKQGDLKLMLSDLCQENTHFDITAKEYNLDPTIKLIPSKINTTLYLTPSINDDCKNVSVECKSGKVFIKNASWINMLKLGVKK